MKIISFFHIKFHFRHTRLYKNIAIILYQQKKCNTFARIAQSLARNENSYFDSPRSNATAKLFDLTFSLARVTEDGAFVTPQDK